MPHEVRIMSSSRNPDLVDEYARTASERGLKVVICSTGMSGHLAAAVAARTVLPVIGVPIASSPQMVGNEALAITAQMPTGVPVATVGVDAAVNAAVLAAEIVAIGDPEVQATLWKFKDDLAEGLKLRSRGTASPRWPPSGRTRPGSRTGSEIEVLAVEAWSGLGKIPAEDARAIRERASFTVERVLEVEAVTRHDVAAFVAGGRRVGRRPRAAGSTSV